MKKYNPNKGYTNDWINLCMDGRSLKRRIKGKEKIYAETHQENAEEKSC